MKTMLLDSTRKGTIGTVVRRRRSAATLLGALLFFSGVTAHAADPDEGLSYGPATRVGKGSARTYVVVAEGQVREMGVAFSEGALRGLPSSGGGHDHGPMEQILALPAGHGTSYQFVQLNWNPEGHEPEPVYGRPHFDVHFYTIPLAELEEIDPARSDFTLRAGRVPEMSAAPAGYLPHHAVEEVEPALVTVPRMGLHWLDLGSPEFNGETFTSTLIFGSFDGRFIFVEPMVARDFLLSRPDRTWSLPRPAAGEAPGAYRVYWDPGTNQYRVALLELAMP